MRVLLVLLLLISGCTRLESNKNPETPPAVLSEFEWTLMPNKGAPEPRKLHTGVWTGKEWLIWGGILITDPESRALYGNGSAFNPETLTWKALGKDGALDGRFGHTAVWTGKEMLVWGGAREDTLNTGGRFNPATNTWSTMSTPTDLQRRYFHRTVWTGDKMFTWGGLSLNLGGLGTGGEYDPVTDQWELITQTNAPSGRQSHSLTLAGRKIYIWGGFGTHETGTALSDGAIYDLNKKAWTALSTNDAPTARGHHSAIYGRKGLIIWGGIGKLESGSLGSLGDGAIYNIKSKKWKKISNDGAPKARHGHTAVWTGKKMLIWGGFNSEGILADGAFYDPETDKWEKLPEPPASFSRRYFAASTWTGEALLIWGGSFSARGHSELGDGAILKFPTKELGD